MTPSELEAFGKDISDLYCKYAPVLGGDYAIDAVLHGIAALIEREKNMQTDVNVIGCLASAAEHLSWAAMDYYASTK